MRRRSRRSWALSAPCPAPAPRRWLTRWRQARLDEREPAGCGLGESLLGAGDGPRVDIGPSAAVVRCKHLGSVRGTAELEPGDAAAALQQMLKELSAESNGRDVGQAVRFASDALLVTMRSTVVLLNPGSNEAMGPRVLVPNIDAIAVCPVHADGEQAALCIFWHDEQLNTPQCEVVVFPHGIAAAQAAAATVEARRAAVAAAASSLAGDPFQPVGPSQSVADPELRTVRAVDLGPLSMRALTAATDRA